MSEVCHTPGRDVRQRLALTGSPGPETKLGFNGEQCYCALCLALRHPGARSKSSAYLSWDNSLCAWDLLQQRMKQPGARGWPEGWTSRPMQIPMDWACKPGVTQMESRSPFALPLCPGGPIHSKSQGWQAPSLPLVHPCSTVAKHPGFPSEHRREAKRGAETE